MAFEVPPLPYEYNALEPYIDTQTMQLHHDKHHAAYVNNLNNALQNQSQLASWTVEDLVQRINEVPESIRTAVRNNADYEAQWRWRTHGRAWQCNSAGIRFVRPAQGRL